MTDVAYINILENGIRHATYHLSGYFTDASNESAVKKVDVAADFTSVVTGYLGKPTGVALEYVKSVCQGGLSATLLWDATTPIPFWTIPNTFQENDLRDSAIVTNTAGAGKTGNILLTTNGAANGASYDIVLRLRKTYGNAS
jgi:hypothetical protein